MEPHDERRLTTILSVDVVGYSRLMAADEAGTLAQLKTHRKELLDTKTAEYHGRVVKLMGDGVLMEFGSVVDAVLFAVDVQRAMRARNAAVPEDRRITYRVGINIGDIIVDGEDIYGDGVNVAARLEGLAEPGGVCVSQSVYNQIKGKVEASFEDLGEQKVKNIPEPVRVYRVLIEREAADTVTVTKPTGRSPWRWAMAAAVAIVVVGGAAIWQFYPSGPAPLTEVASEERMAFPLPEKPSIAVLPFVNMSGDSTQDFFSDGLTEDITSALSKLPHLFVIARNSSFTYKGKSVKPQQVAEDLGVRYVLEGSVQRAGDRVRITAQLIDALTGRHLWSERYDREVEDFFALKDDITLNIISGLQINLTEGQLVRLRRHETDSLEAWMLFAEGQQHGYHFMKEDNVLARELYERALQVDPTFVSAKVSLGWKHWQAALRGWSRSPQDSLEKATDLANQALKLDPNNANAHNLLVGLHILNREYDEAITIAKESITLDPSNSESYATLGWALREDMQPENSIRQFKTAMRLSPYYPHWYLNVLGVAYLEAGQCQEAILTFEELLSRSPSAYFVGIAHLSLARCYANFGRNDEARAAVSKAIEAAPQFTASFVRQIERVRDKSYLERYLATLRDLGLPE